MSTIEKLIRAFEALKTVQLPPAAPSDDAFLRRKDKTSHCITIADAMCNATMKSTQEFSQLLSISIETLLQLCDDSDSDVRMVADESLNRIIRALMDNNVGKIQLELHKEIKKNGSARTLRAALWRFAELCHMIRPQKGKPYMQSLVPYIEQIAKRTEEPVLETLSAAVEKIFQSLGIFSTDGEVKVLLKAFLQNVSSTSAVARRTAASSIVCICLHSKKPQAFITWSLNTVLESLLPIKEEAAESTPAILGALGVMRNLIPHLNSPMSSSEQAEGEMMRGSFGKTKSRYNRLDTPIASLDRYIQIYELSLHFALHKDHNVTNAALECLQQLLRSPPQDLVPVLLSPAGISRSHILASEEQHSFGYLQRRTLSQISVTHSIASDDASILLEETQPETVRVKPKLQVVGESQSTGSLQCDSPVGIEFCQLQSESLNDISQAAGDLAESPLHITTSNVPLDRDSPQVEEDDEIIIQQKLEEDRNEAETDSCVSPDSNVTQCDIGSFCDLDVPLIYCTRLLASNFLLTGKSGGLKKDKEVRVSVKALAMGCIAGVVGLWPDSFVLNLDKSNKEIQCISDVLLFSSHSDPQLRGLASQVVGSLLRSSLIISGNSVSNWTSKHDLVVVDLLQPLFQGLKGDSSVSIRQTISTLQTCLPLMLESQDSLSAIPLLSAAIAVHSNPYWLVKVRLLELLADLPFLSIAHASRSPLLQRQVVNNVFIPLLADEDARVRHAASLAIAKSIPNLFFPSDEPTHDPVTAQAVKLSNKNFASAVLLHTTDNSADCFPHRLFSVPQPFHQLGIDPQNNRSVEGSLSRIVYKLGSTLLTATTRHLMFGCCEALAELSNQYSATDYPHAWNCVNYSKSSKEPSVKKAQSDSEMKGSEEVSSAGGLLSTVLALLTTSPITLDISCQQWLLQLAGNIFSGVAVTSLKGVDSSATTEESTSGSKQIWSFLKDKKMVQSAEMLLGHTVRVLAMFSHVLEETAPTVINPKPVLAQSLPSISSPIKRKSKGSGDGGQSLDKNQEGDKSSEDKRGNARGPSLGYFVNIPHCLRIYELLKSAHTNFKLTLEAQASEKFLALLRTTLNVLSQILEVASLTEVGRAAEELLNYLKVTASVEPVSTVACVQQLLKSLFGTNYGAQKLEFSEEKIQLMQTSDIVENGSGFYEQCYQKPYRELSSVLELNRRVVQDNPEQVETMWTHRQRDRKSPLFKSKDRAALASYIKLFEPMVIKALEQYTVTSDVQLQCRVLQLLSQLVQLRVNYCLLDSDKIFIGFVLKQFELIEKGQILYTEELIPRIFQFLVHLSYEKNHSKAIIGVPEVIQLCDGLMASGQSPVTHCIPALVPVVEDVFLMRGGATSSSNVSELDTQREVLVAVLLRLVEFHQVLELLAMVLSQSRVDNKERWLRWSKKVADALFPLLAQCQVRLESRIAHISLLSLLSSVAPTVIDPVDPILFVMFSEPPLNFNSAVVMSERWLGAVLGVLPQLLVHSSEELVLNRIKELNLDVIKPTSSSHDPLNVSRPPCNLPPDTVLTKFIFQTIQVISGRICNSIVSPISPMDETDYLREQLSHFLFYCIYMFESGSYCRVATTAIHLLQAVGCDTGDGCELPIEEINSIFIEIASVCPLLTFQWCYLLILLGYSRHAFWSRILNTGNPNTTLPRYSKPFNTAWGPSPCCNMEIVRRGGIILFSDFVCDNLGDAEQVTWLLVNHIEEVVRLSKEEPVLELIAAVHRNPAASGLLVQAVAVRCQDLSQPSLVARLVQQCLEGVHPSQSGALIQLIVSRLLNLSQLALTRQASALACKRAEMLLTAPPGEVETQLSKTELITLIHQINSKHERLKGLLKKVALEVYELPFEDNNRLFDPVHTKTVAIDRSWFLSQLKYRCCHSGANGANVSKMLSELKLEEILTVMGSPKLNLSILDQCFKFGCYLSMQHLDVEAGSDISPLFEAAQTTLFHRVKHLLELLPRPHQVFQPVGRTTSSKEQKFGQRLATLFAEPTIWNSLVQLSKAVSRYFESLVKLSLSSLLPTEQQVNFAKFAVLCLEAAHWQVLNMEVKTCPGAIEPALQCAAYVLLQPNIAQEFTATGRHAWLASACSAIYALTIQLMQDETLPSPSQALGLQKALEDPEHMIVVHACPQISILVSWLEKSHQKSNTIPKFLYNSIRMVIVALARMTPLNSYVATPPEVWRQGWSIPLGGPCLTTVSPLPVDMLLETEVLEQFIFRLTLLGWTSRQQFEENWMALLGVLNCTQEEENISLDEINAMIQANGLAVKGITALLIQSLLLPTPGNPITSKLIHQPRELTRLPNSEMQSQLKTIHDLLFWKLENLVLTNETSWQFQDIFQRSNLERSGLKASYGYSQVSMQYLATVTRISEEPNSNLPKPELYSKREECLTASGLDIHSCLHFLLDLYTQWTSSQAHTPLRLLLEAVRSVLMVSDIFTEKAQFQWMLHTFLELGRNHPPEDELLHQFLSLGASKAAAVLGQEDSDVLERVRKMTDCSLRSGFLPSRLCGLHGLLYLLQGPRYLPQASADDTLQLAIEYIQRHMDLASGSSNHSERHLLALWSLVFFLLEEEQVTDTEMAPAVLQLALALVSAGNQPSGLNTALVQGLEKLVLCGTVRGTVGEQVTKLSLERLKQSNPAACISALQLLLTCMYTVQKRNEDPNEADPEVLLQSLEKTSALFDRIKKGYPHEVELFCGVLPTLLSDFFPPSEMLTKVIGEFLSSQQPHPKLLAGVVFQLFERACGQDQLPLLQDWVVISLSNFTQCSPVGMAVWCLTCFFVSASTNPWLRAMFPHIQSRIGRCEIEDRKLLCFAACDFYHKLSESQKQDFMSTFQAAAEPQTPFLDIISSL